MRVGWDRGGWQVAARVCVWWGECSAGGCKVCVGVSGVSVEGRFRTKGEVSPNPVLAQATARLPHWPAASSGWPPTPTRRAGTTAHHWMGRDMFWASDTRQRTTPYQIFSQ